MASTFSLSLSLKPYVATSPHHEGPPEKAARVTMGPGPPPGPLDLPCGCPPEAPEAMAVHRCLLVAYSHAAQLCADKCMSSEAWPEPASSTGAGRREEEPSSDRQLLWTPPPPGPVY